MKTNHSSEPWYIMCLDTIGRETIIGSEDSIIACTQTESGYCSLANEEDEPNAKRIIACVNACKDIPTHVLVDIAAIRNHVL